MLWSDPRDVYKESKVNPTQLIGNRFKATGTASSSIQRHS
jgi:hypothetical protein